MAVGGLFGVPASAGRVPPEGGTPSGSEMRLCLRRFQSPGIATPVSNHYNIYPFDMLYDFIATRMAFSACFDHSRVKSTQVTVHELFTRKTELSKSS